MRSREGKISARDVSLVFVKASMAHASKSWTPALLGFNICPRWRAPANSCHWGFTSRRNRISSLASRRLARSKESLESVATRVR